MQIDDMGMHRGGLIRMRPSAADPFFQPEIRLFPYDSCKFFLTGSTGLIRYLLYDFPACLWRDETFKPQSVFSRIFRVIAIYL